MNREQTTQAFIKTLENAIGQLRKTDEQQQGAGDWFKTVLACIGGISFDLSRSLLSWDKK